MEFLLIGDPSRRGSLESSPLYLIKAFSGVGSEMYLQALNLIPDCTVLLHIVPPANN